MNSLINFISSNPGILISGIVTGLCIDHNNPNNMTQRGSSTSSRFLTFTCIGYTLYRMYNSDNLITCAAKLGLFVGSYIATGLVFSNEESASR